MFKAWEKQEQRKKESTPNPQTVLMYINNVSDSRVRALAAFAYLTGGRISELVREKYLRKTYLKRDSEGKVMKDDNGKFIVDRVEKVRIDYEGVKKHEIEYTEDNKGRRIMLINMQNRKNKQHKRKNIPILVDKETGFVNIIKTYLNSVGHDQALFPFSKTRAYQLLDKHLGWNPHYFRHLRATHLVTIHNLDSFSLLKMMGWTDLRPAQKYVRLNWRDIWR